MLNTVTQLVRICKGWQGGGTDQQVNMERQWTPLLLPSTPPPNQVPYLCWAVLYYFKIFVWSSSKIQQRNYDTLFKVGWWGAAWVRCGVDPVTKSVLLGDPACTACLHGDAVRPAHIAASPHRRSL